MLAKEFKARLSRYLWRSNFDKVMAQLGHTPRYNDRWQTDFWSNLNQLNECLQKLDQETFSKLLEAVEAEVG